MGTRDGSIIATIITAHMPRNDAAAPGHVCPGIRIHAIDSVQPPGIGMPPDMDAHQAIVTAAPAAKSSAETPKKARWEARSALVILVVAEKPDSRLVTPSWRPVEPLVHAPEPVEPARVGRVGVVDDPVLAGERAHPGLFPRERRPVRTGARREFSEWPLLPGLQAGPDVVRMEVVLDDARALLFLCDRSVEIVVEVAPERRCP